MVILDLERNGWRLISTIKCKNHVMLCCLSMGPEGGADLVRLLGYCGYGMNMVLLRKSLYGGRVLRNASAMTAERKALRVGIEYLTFFPTEVSSFDFQVESTDRTVQHKLNAQSLRLFGLHRDVNDAHRAAANRLQTKKQQQQQAQTGVSCFFLATFSSSPVVDMSVHGDHHSGAAKRRRDRRLRMHWRHEQHTLQMVLATVEHQKLP